MAELKVSIDVAELEKVWELVEIMKGLTNSYEYFTYVTCPKDLDDYDEYDEMMSGAWERLGKFIEG